MADLIKLDADLDIIQKLDDEPNDVGGLSSAELKAEFDKAGNAIKTYLNDTLIPGIEGTGGEGGLVGEQIAAHNVAPDAHADIRQEVVLKLDSATIKSEGIPEIVSPETLRTYFYGKRKETSRSWQFEVSTGNNENMVSALGGFPDGHTAAEKWFLYIDLPYTEAGGFVIHAQLEGRDNGLLYRQDQFATLDQRWHTTGWIRIQDVQKNLDAHIADRNNPHKVTVEQIGAIKAPVAPGTEGQILTQAASGETKWADAATLVIEIKDDSGHYTCDNTSAQIAHAISGEKVIYAVKTDYRGRHNGIIPAKVYMGLHPVIQLMTLVDGANVVTETYRFTGQDTNVLEKVPDKDVTSRGLPSGGTNGQVLTQTDAGEPEWRDDKTLVVTVNTSLSDDVASHSLSEIRNHVSAGGNVVLVDNNMNGDEFSSWPYLYTYTGVGKVYEYGADTAEWSAHFKENVDTANPSRNWILIHEDKTYKLYSNPSDFVPAGGTDGQVLTQTSTGRPEWKDAGGGGAEAEKWATEAVKDAIPSITDEATFRTHFYELRKSQTRKYQFEISTGGIHENIVTGVGGRPQGVSADDSAFLYVEIPFSEAGGFVIKATYELRSKAGIWEKKIYGTLDSRWQDTGWYQPTYIAKTIIAPHGSGSKADMTASQIINAARKGVVQAEYTDPGTGELRTYPYFKQMPDGRAAFAINGYIEDGVPKQTLIYVDYAGNVDTETRVADMITPAEVDAKIEAAIGAAIGGAY